MTLDEAFAAFREALLLRNYSPATREGIRQSLSYFLKWLGSEGTREVASVSRSQIEAYQDFLARSELAQVTKLWRVRVVKRWFDWLAEGGYLFESPAERIVLPAEEKRELPEVLSVEEVLRILDQPNTSTWYGIRDRAILELLYSTGIRRSEIHALDVEDLDLKRGLLKVRCGKGRKGRVVPFGKEAAKWVKEYLRDVRPRLKHPPRERAVFLGRFGRRLRGNDIYALIRKAAKKAKIRKPARVHAFRHAFATHMLLCGADLFVIQKLLGHTRTSTTSNVYTRVLPKDLKDEHTRTHPAELKEAGP